MNLESSHLFIYGNPETFLIFTSIRCEKKVVNIPLLLRFPPGDVDIDIQNLYKAVPQLNEVFRIIDQIGEGT